ncbi:urea transporter [Marimonas lutisalis]|uniref:urea transporter n=1 Tax=Marimonas lutisalis TaxID=2545756 RepID=UPI0010F701DD|nr:urea transporter [Marimonas lutisalis]
MAGGDAARDSQRTALVAAWTFLSRTYLIPLAGICLAHSPWVGLGLWGVLAQQPQLALAGVLALTGIELLSLWLVRISEAGELGVADRANGLLSALAGAWLFVPAELSPGVKGPMIAAVVLGGVLLTFLARDLLEKRRLPALVWPYCVIAVIVFTLFPQASARSLEYFHWPLMQIEALADLPEVFLRSMGVFLFSPWPLSGALIAAVLFLWSPALFLAGITGWVAGIAVSSLMVAAGAQVFWAAASYNFFLSGAALGAVFFVPGFRGLFYAVIGGAVAALIAGWLQIILDYSAVSFLPISFAVTLYAGLLVLAAPPFGALQDRIETWAGTPEDNLVARDWLRARWGRAGTPIAGVPMQGALEITQGFAGALSHRGAWRHALDFQRPVPFGGSEEMRPSLWGEAVYAPVEGVVTGVKADVIDNALGAVNFADNWGNHVIMKTPSGEHVMTAHLMQGTVAVAPGQSVGFATQIGLAGNSGRSAVPHLHLHAQKGEEAGAPTRDFLLANFFACDRSTLLPVEWHASGHVAEGAVVMAAAANPFVRNILAGMLPGRGIWTVSVPDRLPSVHGAGGPIVVETALQENGQYMFRQAQGDWMSAALEFDGLRVTGLGATSYSLVSLLAVGLATVPYAAYPGLAWQDWLPRAYPTATLKYLYRQFTTRRLRLTRLEMRCEAVGELAGAVTILSRPMPRPGDLPRSCALTIAPRRGPVKLVVEDEAGTRVYEQISFEPHET